MVTKESELDGSLFCIDTTLFSEAWASENDSQERGALTLRKEESLKKQELIEQVEKIAAPIAEAMSYEIYDIEYEKEGPNWYLKVFMDKEGGFSINDCVAFSHALEEKLEEDDPIETAYILEVSSPGLDRPLKKDKDFQKNLGKLVDVKTYQPVGDLGKAFQATLTAYDEKTQNVSLETEEGETVTLNRKELSGIRLAVVF